MQRFAARWLALLTGITALSSGCIGGTSEATPTRTAPEEKMNGSSDLHRPLHLPTVAPGAACPQTPGARPNPDVAIALGSGPAYPVLGFEGNPIPPKPVVPLHAEDRKGTSTGTRRSGRLTRPTTALSSSAEQGSTRHGPSGSRITSADYSSLSFRDKSRTPGAMARHLLFCPVLAATRSRSTGRASAT
jgi:hypothetical protein